MTFFFLTFYIAYFLVNRTPIALHTPLLIMVVGAFSGILMISCMNSLSNEQE